MHHHRSSGQVWSLLIAGLLVGCGGDSTGPYGFTPPDAGSAPAQAAVSVGDDFFNPASQRVAAGGTVTWTWNGSSDHGVLFPTGTSSVTQTTGTFARTFATAGSFGYTCTVHGSSMSGTIVVE